MITKKARSVIVSRFVFWQLCAVVLMFGFVLPMAPEAMTIKLLLFTLTAIVLALFSYVIRLLEALVRKQEAGLPQHTDRPLRLPREAATPEHMEHLFDRRKK